MPKLLIRLLVFVVVVGGIGYVGINVLLDIISDRAIYYIVDKLQSPNLILGDPSFSSARLYSFNAAVWRDIEINATIGSNSVSKDAVKARINVATLIVKSPNPFQGLFIVSAKGLSVSTKSLSNDASSDEQDAPIELHKGNFSTSLKVNIANPAVAVSQIKNFALEVKKLSEEGKTVVPVEFSAEEIIMIKGNSFAVSVWVERKDDVYRLMANMEDLKFVAENILPKTQTSTRADIEIIANNPIRAPRLLRIRSKASDTALSAHEQDPSVSEDTYRHVLWSYLLTKEYGADFAKEVTDAHEQTTDAEDKNIPNAEAYHQQDYNNNEVGRKHAALGYDESSLLSRVMTDPKVIHDDELR